MHYVKFDSKGKEFLNLLVYTQQTVIPDDNKGTFSLNDNIVSNNQKAGVNVVALVNRFHTSSVKYWIPNFRIHASEGPVIIMNQLKSIKSYLQQLIERFIFTPHSHL